MKKANILIVDDEASSLKLLSRMLQNKGFHVRTLPNGELALKSIENHLPDILLLDVGLPGIDGFEVCRRVKQMKKGSNLPVIFISAYDDSEHIEKGYKSGAVDFIRKPFSKFEVYQKINLHLNSTQYENELEILLTETVLGSIRSLLDILGFMNPDLYSRSNRLARLMCRMVESLSLENAWLYETAALLIHLDEIIYSTEVQKETDTYTGTTDESVIRSRPHISEIMDSVPRMNSVAAMMDGKLSHNLLDERYEVDFNTLSVENKGRILIKLLTRYEALLINDIEYKMIKHFLEKEFRQHINLVERLISILEEEEEVRIRKVKISDLMSGDLIHADIRTQEGILLIGSGTQLTANLLSMLRKYSRHEKVVEPIYIKPGLVIKQ